MRVKLEVLESFEDRLKGKVYSFAEPDKFVFGRAEDCHCRLQDDPYVSRHHFVLEICPPQARLRDLGSKNGTCVNEARRSGPEDFVDLRPQDRIRVGKTVFEVNVERPAVCLRCDAELDASAAGRAVPVGDKVICAACAKKMKEVGGAPKGREKSRQVVCGKCRQDVTDEARDFRTGIFICSSCRQQAQGGPAGLLANVLAGGIAEIREFFAGRESRGSAGAEILNYTIGEEIGRGGMGAVYLAQHKKTNEQAAIKILLPKSVGDERARKTFEREIQVTMSLSHKNIIRFLARGDTGSVYYFILEYAEGGSLATLMDKKGAPLSPGEACPLIVQALEGLSHAHASGFVHRDLKPSNILLAGWGGEKTAKIGDFGLAKSFDNAGMSGMTEPDLVGGSYSFMAKEQLTNYRFVKPVSDVFSMGATLYALLSGQPVYDFQKGSDPFGVILAGKTVPIEKRVPGIPRRLAAVIARSIAVEADDRFQDAAAMRDALLGAK